MYRVGAPLIPRLADPSGRPVRTSRAAGGVEASLVPGVRYTIAVTST
jgi:hypothetical protein